MLYGESGAGKSSLINAGLLPSVAELGFVPERVRVQPRTGEELVIDRPSASDDETDLLPSLLAPEDPSPRIVLSVETFDARLRAACERGRPIVVFDQFEEILTLFDEAGAQESQRALVDVVVTMLREPLPVKFVFAFREDYLGKVKQLLSPCPELVDQSLRLAPPAPETLPTITRGPFERYPRHFDHELSPALTQRLNAALADRFGSGDLSLSEVQTVCLRLWNSGDPEAVLAERGVQGLLEDYLGEALDAFPSDVRGAAIALLSQMVTSAGTRNVLSAEDLIHRVRDDDPQFSPELLQHALERLESESRLIRRERRRDLYLYEVTSEFLLPWISRRRDDFRRMQERHRERRRIRRLGLTVGLLVLFGAIVGALALWALDQRENAEKEAAAAEALALASSAEAQLESRPDVSLELALAAHEAGAERIEVRNSMIGALFAARSSGAVGLLHGHTSAVQQVRFAADGRTVTALAGDGAVRRWDAHTNRPLGRPFAVRPSIWAFGMSPDGRTVAASNLEDDEVIRLWDARTGRRTAKLTGQSANAFAFSRDGRLLASVGYELSTITDSIRIWDVRSRRLLTKFSIPTGYVSGLAFSPSGKTVASFADDRVIRFWDVESGNPQGRSLAGHKGGGAYSAEFSRDGDKLVSVGADERVRVWEVRTREQLGPAYPGRRVTAATIAPDGRTLAVAGGDSVRLWDVRRHRQLTAPLTGHIETVQHVAFSPDGEMLASAGLDRVVRLWDVDAQLRSGRRFPALRSAIGATFSPDGRLLATASATGTVRLWDVPARKQAAEFRGHRLRVIDLEFSPDGETVASAGREDQVLLWDTRAREQLGRPLKGHSPSAIAFGRGGSVLAAAGSETDKFEGELRLWDLDTRTPARQIPTGDYHTNDVAFRPGGRIVATADDDRRIRLWDVRAAELLKPALVGHTGPVYGVVFSRSGRTLASVGDDNVIRLWDVGKRRERKPPLTGHGGRVFALSFSRDGRTLASVGEDDVIRLWDLRSHRQLGRPLEGPGRLTSVAFSGDGRSLVGVSGSTIQVWRNIFWSDPTELREEVCSLVGSSLTRAEWAQHVPGVDYHRPCP